MLKTSPKTLAFDPQIMGNLAQRKCSFSSNLLFMLFYKNPKSVYNTDENRFFKKSHLINESPPKSGYRQMRLEKSV